MTENLKSESCELKKSTLLNENPQTLSRIPDNLGATEAAVKAEYVRRFLGNMHRVRVVLSLPSIWCQLVRWIDCFDSGIDMMMRIWPQVDQMVPKSIFRTHT